MDISRRQLAGVILASTAVAQVPAQAPPTPTAQPADSELEAAKSQQRLRAQIIARVPLPMTTEPAFHFKA
ncbi:MAG: hypothetical protein ACXVG9_13345 [Terriglobales bacterium]